MSTIELKQSIAAPVSQVYRAFTNATALREWMSDVATVLPHEGGRVYLAWNNGYYTAGEFTRLNPNECVEFTWNGRTEPGITHVKITMTGQDSKTDLRLEHTGIGEGEEWNKVRQKFEDEWAKMLRNLTSVLEKGEDLRITKRPMLGIMIGEYNQELASKLNVPVTDAVRLDSTIDGMGAQKAGLQKDDVLVEMDGKRITSFPELVSTLSGREAGDVVEVVYYRGPEKMVTQMKLSGRPIPEIPWTADDLAEAISKQEAEARDEMLKVLEGVTEEEASHKPAPDEWSVKEILAHLILSEQGQSFFLESTLNNQELWADDFGGNVHAHTSAIANVFHTVPELLEELERSRRITVEFVRQLPESFLSRKSSMWKLAFESLSFPSHITQHLEQIQAALNAARMM